MEAARIYATVSANTAPLMAGLARANGAVMSAGARLQARGRAMSAMGASMTRSLTLPIIGAAAASIKLGKDFEAAMERVHTQAGASQKEVDSLRGKVLSLAKSTMQGPTQLAEGLYHLESVGMRGAKAMDTLKIAAEGAAVGNASLEDTASSLAGAWMTQIKGAQNLSKVMGILNATIGAGNMKMEDLNLALGTGILPAAKAAGLGITDVGAALATMTDENMHADAAATRLRMTFSLLAAPSGAAEKQLHKIGLTGLQLGHAMQGPKGLISALTLLKTHLDRIQDPAKRMQILSRAFGGGRSSAAIELLLNNLDRVKMKYDQITGTAGNFDNAVAKTQQTVQYKLHAALSTIEADAIQMSGVLMPIAVSVVGGVASMVEAFSKLPKPIQKGAVYALLFVAALGPVIKLIGNVVTAAGYMAKAIEGVGVALEFLAANPVVLIIAALVALGVGLVVAYKKSATFRAIVQGALHGVEGAAKAVAHFFAGPFVGAFKGAWNAIKGAVASAINFIIGYYKMFLQGIALVLHAAGKLPGPLGAPFRKAADAVDYAIGKMSALQSRINSLHGKTVHVDAVVTGLSYVSALQEHIAMLSGKTVSVGATHRAAGGPVVAGRSYLVGERGPELVTFGANGYVTPNHALAATGGDGVVIENVLMLDGEVVYRAVRKAEARHVLRNGGR